MVLDQFSQTLVYLWFSHHHVLTGGGLVYHEMLDSLRGSHRERVPESSLTHSDDTFSGPATKKILQKKFGMEGTKAASIRWFQQTQKTNKGAVNQEGSLMKYLHKMLTVKILR